MAGYNADKRTPPCPFPTLDRSEQSLIEPNKAEAQNGGHGEHVQLFLLILPISGQDSLFDAYFTCTLLPRLLPVSCKTRYLTYGDIGHPYGLKIWVD